MNTRGYTLLEVSLFLAISGALTLVAIVGLGPRLRNVRFSTAIRDLQGSIVKQLSTSELGGNNSLSRLTCVTNASTGLNIGNSPADSDSISSSCVYVGRVVVLRKDSNTAEYRSIVAARSAFTGCGLTDESSLEYIKNCNQARVVGDSFNNPVIYTYSNGLMQTSPTRAYGFVRSPNTNTLHRFSFTTTASINNIELKDPTLAYGAPGNPTAKEIPVCYELSGRVAKLTLSTVLATPEIVFNNTAGCV